MGRYDSKSKKYCGDVTYDAMEDGDKNAQQTIRE